MEFEQVFDNITFKRMAALRNKVESVVHCVSNYCFCVHAVLKQTVTMIVRIRLL